MNFGRFFAGAGALIGATVVGSALTAGFAAVAGVTGAAIMNSAGHAGAGYITSDAVKMGAVGGAILGAGLTFASKGASALGLFSSSGNASNNSQDNKNQKGFVESTLTYVGSIVVSGLIGYGVLNSASVTVMELGQTAAAFAVGGSVTMIPAGIALLCICAPLVLCCAKNFTKEETAAPAFPLQERNGPAFPGARV